jgi:hypothetical protein
MVALDQQFHKTQFVIGNCKKVLIAEEKAHIQVG